ncbi:STAS domain-containing protein [Methylobacterium sp. NEAU 140]|uniref:STAS domain-containing protein n=1 Tax=Methylobacterium sp. NEAU 140 TaxID=3064945 RepID=UPI0027323830|nr:STAS domain-containing protein [Methylobacterium sp. NEAU 140]MDP4025129.1 STAS domain-containing protein [Methylobacterium sp. NEAU 140]
MQIQETRQDGYLVVEPVGRLDSGTSRILDRSLTSAVQRGDVRIILDMGRLDYIGSMGLSALLAAAKRIKAAQGELLLRGMNERVKLVFEMSGFLRLFNIRDA